MARRLLTRDQARAALGEMPERTFARWCAAGLPVQGEGKRARYPWPEVFRWLQQQLERRGRDQARPATLDQARLRQEAAAAELAELELYERRELLVTVEQVERVVGEAFGRVRGKLLALPQRHATEVVGLADIPAALARLEAIAREVMEELYADSGPSQTEDVDEAAADRADG